MSGSADTRHRVDACPEASRTTASPGRSPKKRSITGQGSSEEATEAITGWLTDVHPGVEVEIHHGGQPLYPYLFGVE